MKIAFCIKTISDENKTRGVGSYSLNLYQALRNIKDHDLQVIDFTQEVPKNADVVHYPFFDPFFLTLPMIKKKPTVVTIHDVIPLIFPKHFPRGIRGEIKWQIQKNALQSVQAIITDSNNSVKDIAKYINFPTNKIFPIYLAASGSYQRVEEAKILNLIKRKYNLPDNFILYVGDVNWNKNVVGLVKAFKKLNTNNLKLSAFYSSSQVRLGEKLPKDSSHPAQRDSNSNLKLVLVGKAFINDLLPEVQEINKTIKDLNMEENIVKVGYIHSEDMAAVYSLAKVYVQPSLYEGFGLPVLDAMCCGCLVASSNKSSLPEVGGNAIMYFDPENIDDMAEKIQSILQFNNATVINMRNNQYQQAKKFSWEKTAKETIGIYKKILK